VDLAVEDGKLIQAMWRKLSDANASAEVYAAEIVNSAWPPGGWPGALATCVANQTPRNLDAVIDLATLEAAPGWTLPNTGQPGGGEAVDGRVYIFRIQAGGQVGESHATVIDGKAYWFPVLPESCNGVA
jgi:hypothetical protein